jgi:hypothetical protein
MPNNFLLRKDLYFDFKVFTQYCTMHIISSLAIKYDDNNATEVKQSYSLVTDYHGYVQFNSKARIKIYWAVVYLVAEAIANILKR